MNLKQQLKLYLKIKSIKASDLARATKIPKQNISDWLAGTSPRDLTMLKKVADYFEITIDHLVFGNGTSIKNTVMPNHTTDLNLPWTEGIFEIKFRPIQ